MPASDAKYVNAEDVERLILDNLDHLSELEKNAKGTDREKLFFKEMGLLDAMAHLREAPTADVREVKRGTWQEKQVFDGNCIEEWQSSKCSVCGRYHTIPYLYYFRDDNYCPNCGADMRGIEDEQTERVC